MPQFPTYDPPWLRDQQDPANWIVPAMKLGIDMRRQKHSEQIELQKLGLEAQKLELDRQVAQTQIAGQQLRNKEQAQEMADWSTLMPWLADIRAGKTDTPMPPISSGKVAQDAHALASKMMLDSAKGQAQISLNQKAAEVFANFDDALGDTQYMQPYSKPWTDYINTRSEQLRDRRIGEAREQELFETGLKMDVARAGYAEREKLQDIRLNQQLELGLARIETQLAGKPTNEQNMTRDQYKAEVGGIVKDQNLTSEEKTDQITTLQRKFKLLPPLTTAELQAKIAAEESTLGKLQEQLKAEQGKFFSNKATVNGLTIRISKRQEKIAALQAEMATAPAAGVTAPAQDNPDPLGILK